MEKLEALSSIARLSEHVVRVLGQNPGKFTLQGTNTYIIGKQNPYTLIDTGEGRAEYIPVLENALRDTAQPTNPDEPDISDIVISHWHHDHVGGLPAVLSLLRRLWGERRGSAPFKPPRLHKFPSDPPANTPHNPLPSLLKSLPPDLYTPSPTGAHFHDLYDSQVISTTSALRVLHTPGHTTDSVCIYVPQDRALYTADTVLGQGTAVFDDLASYIASLNKMLQLSKGEHGYTTLYPGHGPTVSNGPELINTYIQHRLEREAQIVKLLNSPPPVVVSSAGASSPAPNWTTWSIVSVLYADYPQSLWLPAARGIDLHLKKLESELVVGRVGGEGKDTSWTVVSASQ